jgi:aminomethyltransferase
LLDLEAALADQSSGSDLKQTPLHHAHIALGARMVAFAGYLKCRCNTPPASSPSTTHTRGNAGLFDVSHMGQAFVRAADFATAAAAMETLVPADIASLAPGQQRYSQLLNEDGGIIDDLMIARSAHPGMDGGLYLVVNASRKQDRLRPLAPAPARSVRA